MIAQVQKSATHYTEAARDEIEMLQRIAEGPPESTAHCVQLLDSFDHRGPHGLHVCMVFEARAARSQGIGVKSQPVSPRSVGSYKTSLALCCAELKGRRGHVNYSVTAHLR